MRDPASLVGTDQYLDALEAAVERAQFPNPDPDLVPELTEARYVARAARGVDDPEYAERVEAMRDPVFDPLLRFDLVAGSLDQLRTDGDPSDLLDGVDTDLDPFDGVDLDQDPEGILTDALDRRELTFLDYVRLRGRVRPGRGVQRGAGFRIDARSERRTRLRSVSRLVRGRRP